MSFALFMRPFVHCAALVLAAAILVLSTRAGAAGFAEESLIISDTRGSYSASRHLFFLEDPTRQLTVEDIGKPGVLARFQAATVERNEVNFGYSASAYWLALPIELSKDAPGRWLLEVAFSSLDRVDVFRPLRFGGFAMQTAGDLQPFSQRPMAHRNLVFPLELQPGERQTIFIRVQSGGSLTVPITLWRPEALQRDDQSTYALLSLYYGMLLGLMLYNLLLFFAIRDRTFLSYVCFVACMAIGQASLNGLGNQFLWPDWPAWGNIALPSGMAATGFFGALFTRQFLTTREHFPRLDRLIIVLAGLFALAAVAPVFTSYRFAAIFTSVTGLAFAITAVIIGIYCDYRDHPGARYFLIAWSLLLVGVAVLAARNLGWIPTTNVTRYSMQIGSALEMLLLSFALADRINTMRHEKEIANLEALAAKETLVEGLRQTELELEARVTARTQDLATANVALREKERELAYLASHDSLTGLANRNLFLDRIERTLARAHRNGRRAALMIVDVDQFKAINDHYGHEAGDTVLQAVASRLSECVREADTVARVGGDEFFVILDDINERADAERVAEKLLAVAALPIPFITLTIHATVSIGIACFPEHGGDAAELMRRADDALYRAKNRGRDRFATALT